MLEQLHAERGVADDDPSFAYPAIVIRWGERYYAAERDLADELLRELDSLREHTSA
jgi:hypothetical protein